MPSRTWHTTLDDAPLELRADLDLQARTLVVFIDGFPTHRARLPDILGPQQKVVTMVSGHRVVVVAVPTPQGAALQAAIDGKDLDQDRGEEALGLPQPGGALVPARLAVDLGHYYACYPRWLRGAATALLASITMLTWSLVSVWQHQGWTEGSQLLAVLAGGAAITAVGWLWRDAQRQRHRFGWGDTRPGVVVALDPVRVAIAVDLTIHTDQRHPHVRVSEQPIDQVQEVAIGDRVAMVLLYADSQDGRRWHDVDAVAAVCGCTDQAAIDGVLEGFSPGAWQDLDLWWAAVGRPTEPGLYPVRPRS